MKIARYECYGLTRLGIINVDDQRVDEIAPTCAAGDAMIAFIEQNLAGYEPKLSGAEVQLEQLRFLPPLHQPSKNVLCVGKNYRAHAHEFANSGFDATSGAEADAVPAVPIIFSKAPCTLSGARDDIEAPASMISSLDYEGELGVIIGRPGRGIKRRDALDHVWGYTVINDVTARDLQSQHKQWLLGKSIDTFCPIGPWIVTADEVDVENLQLSCWVNDERRQHASTADLIFDVPTIVETISRSMTLLTGDIIATGTPAGVGIGFEPPKFLKADDVVRVRIEGIGEIENRVVEIAGL